MSALKAEILVVDDERAVRAAYRALFEREGYSVRVARGGGEALRLLGERAPDVVLLDIDMPDMTGYAVCRAIRGGVGPQPIVIFLTAMETDADQLRGLGAGADDYVFKTASNEILTARVSSALARRERAREDAATSPREISIGRFRASLDTFETFIDGRHTGERLTKTEADILRALVAAKGRLLSAAGLVESMRGEGHVMEPSTMRSHITHIRAKLGPAAPLLVTERDAGFRVVR